jgi:hypothetical protein
MCGSSVVRVNGAWKGGIGLSDHYAFQAPLSPTIRRAAARLSAPSPTLRGGKAKAIPSNTAYRTFPFSHSVITRAISRLFFSSIIM